MILRRLYVKKSLKNTSEGVEFTLKNILADATINKPLEITIDNNPVPLEKVILVAESKTTLLPSLLDPSCYTPSIIKSWVVVKKVYKL
jgi:hypothetical protein